MRLVCPFCLLLASLITQRVNGDENAQMGIVGPLGSGGSCGFANDNTSSMTSGAYQGTISSGSPVIENLPTNGCGACLSVQCNALGNEGACKVGAGPITLAITDSCPSCSLNVPVDAFNQIADTALGNINVDFHQVPCPGMGNMIVRIKEYRESGGGYIKIIIVNAASSGAMQSVEVKSFGNEVQKWEALTNNNGGTWEGSLLPDFPWDIRLRNSYGQLITIQKAIPADPSGDIHLDANFPRLDESQIPPSPAGSPQASILPTPPSAGPVQQPQAPQVSIIQSPLSVPGAMMTQNGLSQNLIPGQGINSPSPLSPAPSPGNSGLQLAPLPPSGSPCVQINDFLNQSPSLQTWNKLLQSSGYKNNFATAGLNITMFAPTDSAFTEPVLRNTNLGASAGDTINSLLASSPNSVNGVIGYHLLYGVVMASQLTVGSDLDTTDTIKTIGQRDRYAQLKISGPNQIQGIGTSAKILETDLEVCGPSVVHVINAVLLPVALNAAPSPSSVTAAGR